MYLNESESLLAESPSDEREIEALDAFMAKRSPADVLHPRHVAKALGMREAVVVRLLNAYESHGALRHQEMIECSTCEHLSPADEVRQAVKDQNDYPCDICQTDLTEDPSSIRTFRLLFTPTADADES